ncbi:hypothetical protein MMC08_008782 [Hypocenomyce scalaris]|nr:hypothetical protein [Hypocenomyce scalaris]
MLLALIAAFPLILTAFGDPGPSPGLSLGELFAAYPPEAFTDEAVERDLGLIQRQLVVSTNDSVSASYNDSGAGYNISVPHWLCENNVIGDFVTPSGATIANATVGDIYQNVVVASHTSATLVNWLTTRANTLQANFNTTFSNSICDPPPASGRSLLWYTVNVEDTDGYWTASVLCIIGGGVIGFPGLWGAIGHNLPPLKEASALVAVAALEYILYRIVDRLQRNKLLNNRVEAFILSAFITAGQNIYSGVSSCPQGTCTLSATIAEGVASLAQKAGVLCGCGGGASSAVSNIFGSSANLVQQDVQMADMC